MTQPIFEAVDFNCPVCKAAAVVYVPSNLMRGDLKIHCFGCENEGTIRYDKTEQSDGKIFEHLTKREEIYRGE